MGGGTRVVGGGGRQSPALKRGLELLLHGKGVTARKWACQLCRIWVSVAVD